MRISVALCTYNGERYLAAQLESILDQTRKADEIVVADDVSSDGTLSIVERYAQQQGSAIRLVRNAENLLSTANFAQAIGLCTGDVIVLCDQDDVWHQDKLAAIEQEFTAHPQAGMVLSDARIVDENLQPLGYTAWEAIGLSRRKRELIEQGQTHRVFLSQYVATGATMAFRSEFKSLVLPIPANWVHDAWIAFLLAAVAPVRFIDRPLIDYRQHASQQIGLRKMGVWDLYRKAIVMRGTSFRELRDKYQMAYDRLVAFGGADREFLAGLEQKLAHLARRDKLRRNRLTALPAIFSEMVRGNYARYSYGWKSIVQDLFFFF